MTSWGMLLPALLFALADTGAATACGADSMYARAPVYVRVTVASPADAKASGSLLPIAQAVATRVRQALGVSADSVPRGDGVVAEALAVVRHDDAAVARHVDVLDSAGLRVVARRDGTMRWTPMWRPAGQDAPLGTTALLDRALADAKAADETFIIPEHYTADSIAFTLTYEVRTTKVDGVLLPTADRPAALAAFTLRVPLRRPPVPVGGALDIPFPAALRDYASVEGFTRVAFVVDTNGRVDPSTIRDLWPADRPRLKGLAGNTYDRFIESATEAIQRARFTPAEVAGCRVRQLVVQSVTWTKKPPPRPYMPP